MSNKILFIINNLGYGGAETVFVNDANALHKLGYDVCFAILYGDKSKSPLLSSLRIESNKIFFLESKSIYDINSLLKFRNLLKSLGRVSVYSTLNDAIFFSRFAVLFFKDISLFIREANVAYPKPKIFKIFDILMNFLVKNIIVVSKEVGVSLESYLPFYKGKIAILYNGVNIPESSHIDDGRTILANGSLTPKKDQKTLILAFLEVLRSYPEASLRIIGDGVMRLELESFIQDIGVVEKVKFLGNLERQSVDKEYMKASVFVLSSTREGCPNVLLEAMSFGIPSIATNVGAVTEIINDGQSGYVVPVKDVVKITQKIIELMNDSALRKKIGDLGRQRIIENFSMSKHIDRLISIIFV
ncbi:MAG: glycosyltransferase family 4 protein [Minisyncoccia bacterium]